MSMHKFDELYARLATEKEIKMTVMEWIQLVDEVRTLQDANTELRRHLRQVIPNVKAAQAAIDYMSRNP